MAGAAGQPVGRRRQGKRLVAVVEEGAGQSEMVELNVVAQHVARWVSSIGPVQSSGSGSCWRRRKRLRS